MPTKDLIDTFLDQRQWFLAPRLQFTAMPRHHYPNPQLQAQYVPLEDDLIADSLKRGLTVGAYVKGLLVGMFAGFYAEEPPLQMTLNDQVGVVDCQIRSNT